MTTAEILSLPPETLRRIVHESEHTEENAAIALLRALASPQNRLANDFKARYGHCLLAGAST